MLIVIFLVRGFSQGRCFLPSQVVAVRVELCRVKWFNAYIFAHARRYFQST